jgi:hypothetical protein
VGIILVRMATVGENDGMLVTTFLSDISRSLKKVTEMMMLPLLYN